MLEHVPIANGSDLVIRRKSSLEASKTLPRRGASPASDEGVRESSQGSLNAEAATLERLRAALTEILNAVTSGLQGDHNSEKRYTERAAALLRIDPGFANGIEAVDFPGEERAKPIRGLEPWQIHRVRTHIEANLDTKIRINDLAALAKMSSSHFSRAFKESVDETPHCYVMRRRAVRAQALMLTTDASLGQIAVGCGLSDQSHLNRVFLRFVGESPAVWRRSRAKAPAL